MQTLYTTDLPLPGDPSDTWEAAEVTLANWTTQRLGLDELIEGAATHNADQGTSGRVTSYTGDDGSRLKMWQTRKVAPSRPLWAYDVTAWLSHDTLTDPDRTLLRIRLSAHGLHGRVAELPEPPAAPGIARTLLEQYNITADGYRLGHRRLISETEIATLVEHLFDPTRRRPVLVLTPTAATGEPAIDATRTATRLAGLAHVVVLNDRATSRALTDALGRADLSVFGGAARLYWPDLAPDDRRTQHPLWFVQRLLNGGPNRFADMLFARLGRLSALTLGPPALEARLRREGEATRRAGTLSQLQTVTFQYNDALRELETIRAADQVAVPAEEVVEDDWFTEHEKVSDELEATANERDDLQAQLDLTQQELVVAHDNIRAMAVAMGAASSSADGDAENDEDAAPAPESVLEAVEVAAATCPYLEFLPESFASAAASEFPTPERVLHDLQALNEVAETWARDALPASGFDKALNDAGITGYRPGISSTARQQYAADYERNYAGENIMLGPHIARGIGAPTTIMRIYWWRDAANKVLVVGHVGKKLRDDSNPS